MNKTKISVSLMALSALIAVCGPTPAFAQNSALATSGMGGGASSTARLTAQMAQQQDRVDEIEVCGNKAKPYGPSFGGAKDGDNCVTGIHLTTAGDVGIGNAGPTRKLDVTGDAKINTLRLGEVGHGTAWPGIANNALADAGGEYAVIQNSSGQTLVNAASGQKIGFRIANSEHMTLGSTGNLGVGTTGPTSKLHVVGTGNITSTLNVGGAVTLGNTLSVASNASANAFFYNSDRNLKNNIAPVANGLAIIEALEPVTFDYIRDDSPSIGFIAQEVQKVLPVVVTNTPEGTLGVDYAKIVAPLVAAVKEQQEQIQALEEQIEDLSARLEAAE